MGKYIKDISTLLNLDLGEYRKNRTQEDWLRKLTKNNQKIQAEILQFKEPPSTLELPLTNPSILQEFMKPKKQQRNRKQVSKRLIISNIRKQKPYLPEIYSPKAIEQSLPVDLDKSPKRLLEKKQKEKVAIHLVNITNGLTLEINDMRTLKLRPPQQIRAYQFRKLCRKQESTAENQNIFNDSELAKSTSVNHQYQVERLSTCSLIEFHKSKGKVVSKNPTQASKDPPTTLLRLNKDSMNCRNLPEIYRLSEMTQGQSCKNSIFEPLENQERYVKREYKFQKSKIKGRNKFQKMRKWEFLEFSSKRSNKN